jgi:hypothetical protein
VSKGVAEWFIELDDGGLSFIDTPLCSALTQQRHMYGTKNIEELSFKAERGIRQGVSASSLQWTLMYDMVLEWINPKIGIST